MDKRERDLRARFVDGHGITAEEFLNLVTPGDEKLMPGDDIGFVLAVHHAQLRNRDNAAPYHPNLRGTHYVALMKTQHLAFFFHRRMSDEDRTALQFLDALSTQPGWPPVQHYYDNLYETLMGLPTSVAS